MIGVEGVYESLEDPEDTSICKISIEVANLLLRSILRSPLALRFQSSGAPIVRKPVGIFPVYSDGLKVVSAKNIELNAINENIISGTNITPSALPVDIS